LAKAVKHCFSLTPHLSAGLYQEPGDGLSQINKSDFRNFIAHSAKAINKLQAPGLGCFQGIALKTAQGVAAVARLTAYMATFI
jgi:hypothetical protein